VTGFLVRPATWDDAAAIGEVETAAFGRDDEAQLAAGLETGGYVRVSLVAEAEGRVVGHVLLSEVELVCGGQSSAELALAPVAVLPQYQRQGMGMALVWRALEEAARQGCRAVFVVGDPHFYEQFGFGPGAASGVDSPYQGPQFLALDFHPELGRMEGQVYYPEPFVALP
jgi:putative acetyltransferase